MLYLLLMLRNCFKVISLNSSVLSLLLFLLHFCVLQSQSIAIKTFGVFCLFVKKVLGIPGCFLIFKNREIKMLFENASHINGTSFLWFLIRNHLDKPFQWGIPDVNLFSFFFKAVKIFYLEGNYAC